MNYQLHNENNEFNIYETNTKQVIKTLKTKDEGKKLIRHLNFGGGFDGYTPPFFLKSFTFKFKT